MSAFPTCLLPAGVLVALDGSTCSFEGSTRNSDYQEGPGTCHCEEKAGGDIDHQGTSKSQRLKIRACCCPTTISSGFFKCLEPLITANTFFSVRTRRSQGLEEKIRTLEDKLRRSRQDEQDLRAQLNVQVYRPSAGPGSSPHFLSQTSQGGEQHCLAGGCALSCLSCCIQTSTSY